jgi:hypothetical protein
MKVYSSNGKMSGKVTGSERHCQLEGCRGTRMGVRWSDGKLTYPCTKGMKVRKDGNYQIIS